MFKTTINILGLLAVLFLFNSCGYNSMVELDESVDSQWAQVENVYQRRADLIPNLVATVKGAANFEKETITAVMDARARATSITIDPTNITPDALQKFQEAQDGLSSSLGRLMMVSERYPDLKSNANFRDLQSQLEGTENRITVERKKFNDVTKNYNSYIRKFPSNVTAGMFSFDKKPYFEAEKTASEPVKVDFGK
jgi:LemA protein